MAKQELRRVPFIGWVMEQFRVIFVNRGAHDTAAFSQCIDALTREREKLLVFVEGTRCNREKHVRAKTGAVRMAAESGVPIVPVFVTRNKTPFCPVSVVFGEPYSVGAINPNDHDACQQASDCLLKRSMNWAVTAMQIRLAETAGFCFGVERAVALAEQTARTCKMQLRSGPSSTTAMSLSALNGSACMRSLRQRRQNLVRPL